jgi:hypothetical protein
MTLIWFAQVMRKKTDAVSVVSNKLITKVKRIANTRDKTTKNTSTLAQSDACSMPSQSGISVSQCGVLGVNEHVSTNARENMGDDMGSDTASRERSVTPTESDLLKYLTSHITNPVVDELTSFVISREEYLKGIVDLVMSDCPEVVHDMDCFMTAMQAAFRASNADANPS